MNRLRKFKIGDLIQHKKEKFILEILDWQGPVYSGSNGEYIVKDIKTDFPFSSSTVFIETNYRLLTEFGKILYK
jgi:hypothetical protein